MKLEITRYGIFPNKARFGQEQKPIEEVAIALCLEWLKEFTSPSGRWSASTSYGYKHTVEQWTEKATGTRQYIPNGALIAAADALGYVWKPSSTGSPNAIFKMRVFDRPKSKMQSVVYLLRCGPYYKIGVSVNVESRINQISTSTPFDIELLHTIETEDMYALESTLHEQFADKRKNGEWFELDPADVEYIKGL